jgi:squalene synthase HpnC
MSTVSAELESEAGEGRPPAVELAALVDKASLENFPVASRVLPRAVREQLFAIYGFARLVDDIGDRSPGDRLSELDWAERELDRALAGTADEEVFVRLGECARAIGADREPFACLIEANRQDQVVSRYETISGLEAYCALSANPVGRLVLKVFDRDEARTRALSDSICTGLQLVEHLQDIGEDFEVGRVYLPIEDLRRFAVTDEMLAASSAAPELRRLVAFEARRARTYIESGLGLVRLLDAFGALAVAGFAGGGLAQLDAIERAGFDVLAAPVKASARAVARATLAVLVGRRSR